MSEPKLLDEVELLVDLPEQKISAGDRGTIVEVYPDENYEESLEKRRSLPNPALLLEKIPPIACSNRPKQSFESDRALRLESAPGKIPRENRREIAIAASRGYRDCRKRYDRTVQTTAS